MTTMTTMTTLRKKLIRLAHANPELRPHVLPLIAGGKTAGRMPTVVTDVGHAGPTSRKFQVSAATLLSGSVWLEEIQRMSDKARDRVSSAFQKLGGKGNIVVTIVSKGSRIEVRADANGEFAGSSEELQAAASSARADFI